MGTVGLPIRYVPYDGWGVFDPSVPVRTEKKNRFLSDNGGSRRTKVVSSPHHAYRATVNGHVEGVDTKGSTWISKDTR